MTLMQVKVLPLAPGGTRGSVAGFPAGEHFLHQEGREFQ
tara:strand:- start:928 stop:1044 length:117 start_codon:yes stop_codon:yes gene_type:complete